VSGGGAGRAGGGGSGAAPERPGAGDAKRIRTLIVDDEPLARSLLREYLGAHPDIEIVAECANGFEAVKAVAEHEPDLLFLDIQMPKLTGFEVVDLLERDVAVVFVTAYDEHALKAFDVHAIDYVLKPLEPARLARTLEHVRRLIGAPGTNARYREVAAASLPETRRPDRILIRDQAKVHVVPVEQVDYIEALDDYVCVHAGGVKHLKQQTLAELERLLDPERFVRIHRSYLLNVERLARIEPFGKDSRVAVLKSGAELPVSRAGYQRLAKLM